jgi:Tol biopolymer transport system component/DNA-binding winged helix-turn-helix (wHTH) protein
MVNLTGMRCQINHLYRFGPFLLDTYERLLMRDGKVVPLSPKVFETLLVLVENSGRILGKDELMQTLWPDTYVEESNLTQNISQIRKALGDGEWIETIPKRGYRFAAQVQIEANEQGAAAASLSNGAAAASPHPANGSSNGVAVAHDHAAVAPSLRPVPAADRQEAQPSSSGTLPARLSQKFRRPAAVIFVGLGVLSLALFIASHRADTQADKIFQHFKLAKLTASGRVLRSAVSHDGKYVAYVEGTNDEQSLLVRQVSTTSQATVVAPSDVKFLGVTFSPDDTFIYYVVRQRDQTSGALFQVPVLGGAPKKMLSGVDSPATLSPDGQYVAFARNHPAQREISLMLAKLDGTEERKLLTRKRPEMVSLQGPAWSPDGKLIACAAGYGVSGEASFQILAVKPADGSARPISNQTWSDVGQIAWLGDGSGLVFNAWRRSSAVYGDPLWLLTYPKGEVRQITNDLTSYEGASVSADSAALVSRQLARVSRIWILPATGTGFDTDRATQLQSGFGDNYSEQFGLDWTPDGHLLYASHASGNLDIWISSADGRQQQLTRDRHTDMLPAVSADGRYIVFVSDRGGTRAIWRMDIDGNNPRQLTRGKGDSSPSLSPDGKWVVYSSLSNDRPTLWRVPIDGGEPVQLTDKTTFRPVVSPDGQLIACFYQDEKEFKNRLAVIPFAGGQMSVIEPVAFPEHALVRWTPDSRALCYIVTRQGVSNLWRSPLDGGAPVRLTSFTTDQIFRFAWSRDGKHLACERGMTISDVVLISNSLPE